MNVKNIAEGSFEEVFLEEGFYVLKIQNNTPDIQIITRDINSSYIQFHFCFQINGFEYTHQGIAEPIHLSSSLQQ